MAGNSFDDGGDRPVHVRHQSFTIGDLSEPGSKFDVNEATYFDPHTKGIRTIEQGVLYEANCGHIVGSIGAAEIAGYCEFDGCGNSLCFRCVGVRCAECNSQLCPHHQHRLDNGIYCLGCYRDERLKRGALALLRSGHAFMKKNWKD